MIHHPNISNRIYDIILKQISSRKLKPGTRLKEEQLTEELGVSRTPLRDAITRMVKDGYLEAEPRKGARVRKILPKDIAEIYDIRMALESLAVRLSLPKIDPEELVKLKNIFNGKDASALPGADARLHHLIVHNCGNKRLVDILANLEKLVSVFRLAGYDSPARSISAVADHLRIIEALLKNDPDLAEKEVRNHIENTKRQIIAEFENSQT